MKLFPHSRKAATILAAAGAALLISASGAAAKDMECRCSDKHNKYIDGTSTKVDGTTYKFKCKKTFSYGKDTNTDDYNKYVKAYWNESTSSDKSIGLKIRPRKSSECLNGVYDDNGKALWQGANCNTSDEKKYSSLTLRRAASDIPTNDFKVDPNTGQVLSGQRNPTYSAGGAATTTTKRNILTALYELKDSQYRLIAGCIEDK